MGNHTIVILAEPASRAAALGRLLQQLGATVVVSIDKQAALAADALVLPDSLGPMPTETEAYVATLAKLQADVIVDKRLAGGRAVLGIGSGFHILFERISTSDLQLTGFGQWPGVVEQLNLPQSGHRNWARLGFEDTTDFTGAVDAHYFFSHRLGIRAFEWPERPGPIRAPQLAWITGTSGVAADRCLGAVANGALWGVQFRPERSGAAGQQFLQTWLSQIRN